MEDVYQNSVVFKVRNGTERGDENLCASCANCHHFREGATGRETVSCHANYQNPMRLRGPIARCNRYIDARRPTLNQMVEIAWQVETSKTGKTIGFISPDDLRRRGQPSSPNPVGF